MEFSKWVFPIQYFYVQKSMQDIHVKCLLLSNFNQICNALATNFRKASIHLFSWCYIQRDGQIDIVELIGKFMQNILMNVSKKEICTQLYIFSGIVQYQGDCYKFCQFYQLFRNAIFQKVSNVCIVKIKKMCCVTYWHIIPWSFHTIDSFHTGQELNP